MNILINLALLLAAGPAAAFDLPAVNTATLRAAPAAQLPASLPTKQAYTGALPTGDLFGPLPPYFHEQMPPLQLSGQVVLGAYEYSNKIIFYKDQAEALAAAEKAAEAIRAAGLEVLSVKAEELNGFYYTSVGFAGKRAILYRWDDDAPTAEKAAEIMKRKTDRYASEGYSILETNINKVGDKHFFFIMCAKFF